MLRIKYSSFNPIFIDMATKKIEDFINSKSKEKFSYAIHTKEIRISTDEFTKIHNYLTSSNFSKLHMEIKRIENL